MEEVMRDYFKNGGNILEKIMRSPISKNGIDVANLVSELIKNGDLPYYKPFEVSNNMMFSFRIQLAEEHPFYKEASGISFDFRPNGISIMIIPKGGEYVSCELTKNLLGSPFVDYDDMMVVNEKSVIPFLQRISWGQTPLPVMNLVSIYEGEFQFKNIPVEGELKVGDYIDHQFDDNTNISIKLNEIEDECQCYDDEKYKETLGLGYKIERYWVGVVITVSKTEKPEE